MKKIIKEFIKELLIPKDKLLVFTFHQASIKYNPQLNNTAIWSSIEFLEEQIQFILKNYDVIHLNDGIKSLRIGNLKGTKVAITFDDGDISVRHFILPLLKRLKVPATFFLNSAYLIGEKKGYWFNIYNYLKSGNDLQKSFLTDEIALIAEKLRNTDNYDYYNQNFYKVENLQYLIENEINFYLSLDDLKLFDTNLFDIGLHGHEHQRFSMMSKVWQMKNIIRSIEIVSSFPTYKPIFALPFGKSHDWNNDTIDICKDLGLEIAFSNGGFNTKRNFGIERIPADGLRIESAIRKLEPKILKRLKLS